VKKPLTLLLKGVVSTGLLVWLAQQVQWAQVWQHAQQLPWYTLPLCVGLYHLAQWLSAWRWQIFLTRLGMGLPQRQLFGWILAGMVYNQFLPGTVGGDGFRIWQASTVTGQPKTRSTLAVLADRGVGLAIIVWLGALASAGLQVPQAGIMASLAAIIVLAMLGLAVFPGSLGWLQPAQGLMRQPAALLKSLALSVLIQGLMLGIHVLLAPEVPWLHLVWAYCGVTILTLLPVSLNGLGLREAGYVTLLQGVCPPEKALTLSVLWFVVGLLTSLLGLPAFWGQSSGKAALPAR
jgi:glycosyltransferase 2 family protein